MAEYVPTFSNLERDFDESTIPTCWSCSRFRNELSFLPDKRQQQVGVTLQTKGKQNYIFKWGKWHNKFCPDFVILTEDELQHVQTRLKLAAAIGEWQDPFDDFMPSLRRAVEVNGNWTHSENVIGITETEHVRQVINAYNSIGWEVEIVWERDLHAGNISTKVAALMGKNTPPLAMPSPAPRTASACAAIM